MIYAISVYEKIRGDCKVFRHDFVREFSSPAVAEHVAIRLSYKIMNNSPFIQNLFELEGFKYHSDEWWERLYEKESQNVAYDIHEVRLPQDKSIEELEDEFLDNKELFIKTYCS